MEVHDGRAEPWKVTLVDTGDNVQTGGRLAAVSEFIKDEEFAKAKKIGMWAMIFQYPWDFRREPKKNLK